MCHPTMATNSYYYIVHLILLLTTLNSITQMHANDEPDNVEYKTVQTTGGVIRGLTAKTLFEQKHYFAFKGIPFAKPPVGELRFKAPQPIEPWNGVRDTFQYAKECVQEVQGTILGDEDCLFLNVFVPDVKHTAGLPIMFFIHGGGFNFGAADDILLGPDFLVDEDVIVVTTSYRLAVFGFLALGTKEYSGNMGLKDQLMALKWINENAEAFGGDKNRITIFGHSAGGVCTNLQLLTPHGRDLYQRAIVMSGNALNSWANTEYTPEDYLWQMFLFASDINQTAYNTEELENVLKTVPAYLLLKHTVQQPYTTGGRERHIDLKWTPRIEQKSDIDPFIIESAEDIYHNSDKFASDKDVMFGFTDAEWYLMIAPEVHNTQLIEEFNEHFHLQLPFKGGKLDYDSEEYKSLANEIRTFYFGENVAIDNETLIEYNEMLSDIWMVYDMDRVTKLHAKKSNGKTYYYRFSIDSRFNHFKMMTNITLPGSIHADELCYLFRCHQNPKLYDDVNIDSVEYRAVKQMTKLWTNFAKYGNPTPNNEPVEFQPIDGENIHFLDIQNDGLYPALNPHQKSIHFWNNIRRKFNEFLDAKQVNKRDEF